MMKRTLVISLLLFSLSFLCAQWHIDEGFEGITTLPAGWTIADDGDGMTWRNLNHANSHNGSRAAFVDNYLPNQNADWLITPSVTINAGDSLTFYTRAWTSTENLYLYASTTGAQPTNFVHQLAYIQNVGTTYQCVSVPLAQFIGDTIRIGFYWECTNYGILLDDIKLGQPEIIIPELNLPETIEFFVSDTVTMSFGEYIVCTDTTAVTITQNPNSNLLIHIDGLSVSFSSSGFVGNSVVQFSVQDQVTNLTATDSISVNVLANPSVDLYLVDVLSPREYEYMNMPFVPMIVLGNGGISEYSNQVEIEMTVYDNEGNALSSDELISGVTIAPNQFIQLPFQNSITMGSEGDFLFYFQINSIDDYMDNNSVSVLRTIVHRITAGGPDTFGYRFVDSNDPVGTQFDWIDISQTGASAVTYNVSGWGGDDNFSEPIPLGFSFPFYGSSYTSANVDINGELLLGDNTWYNPYPGQNWNGDGNMFNYMYPIPGYTQMPGLIAVYWDDLHADQGTGDIFFESFGEAPNRYTVIQWHNLRFHAGSGGIPELKFQVILYENGNIKMQYHTVSTSQTGATIPHNNGRSATVAIQNEAANSGLVFLREIVQQGVYTGVEPSGNLLHDNLAILFYTGIDTMAPIITHKAIGNTFDSSVSIVAEFIDMSPLESTTLYYNTGSGWQNQSTPDIELLEYTFQIDDLFPGSTVHYYFQATDSAGNTSRLPESAPDNYYSFKVLPNSDSAVLILYSGNQDYQRVELPLYEDTLSVLHIPYDVYDWEEYDEYSIPEQYTGVIAYASTGSPTEKARYLANTLMNFLDAGSINNPKNVWFASDGFASGQHANPDSSPLRRLMSGYFRTSYVPTGFGGGTNGLGGPDSYTYQNGTILALANTPVGTVDQEYAVFANTPDCIFPSDSAGDAYWDEVPYPEIGAIYTYAFEDGPINGNAYLYHGVAATTVETPSYRTMFFSFDFSQLSSVSARLEWMDDLMTWWEISPVQIIDDQVPNIIAGIKSIYPNPCNPSTNIQYTLTNKAQVEISIYNIKGQLVTTLEKECKSPGNHSISWNGTDNLGNVVGSGVYFVRLQTGGKQFTKKVSIIK